MINSPTDSVKCEGMTKPEASKRLLGGENLEFSSPVDTLVIHESIASNQLVARSFAVPKMSRPPVPLPAILRASISP